MGLVKTVFSPFTSTVPLVSIILVLILIVVFRLSGGGISDNEQRISKKHIGTENIDMTAGTKKLNLKDSGTITVKADELNELMRRRKPRQEVKKEEKKDYGNFDDIEAELGLR